MRKTRTFIDAGVLIAAARGTPEVAEKAFAALDSPALYLVTSDFIRLEVLPKAIYHQSKHEVDFYNAFFENADRDVKSPAALVAEAMSEARVAGLSAVDALHIAAARRAKCTHFLTSETAGKPLFRVAGMRVESIR